MSSNEKISTNVEPVEWSAEDEIKLFFALEGLKPVGVNKHFYMACIAERLSKSLNRDVPAEVIWAHLRILYNLDMLDELEPLPFPNEQIDFTLPDTEYSVLLSKKHSENEDKHLSEKSDGSVIPTNKALPPPSIIAVITANTSKDKVVTSKTATLTQIREFEKKILAKLEAAKRTPKRTRGSMSLESNSPSTTPPPMQNQKRRRI